MMISAAFIVGSKLLEIQVRS